MAILNERQVVMAAKIAAPIFNWYRIETIRIEKIIIFN
jgi:hypothetical protein